MNAVRLFPSYVSHDARFWLWWVGLATIGWFSGGLYGLVLGIGQLGDAMAVLSVSAGVGLVQWMILGLTHASPAHRWRWWVPASLAGMALPLVPYSLIWSGPFTALDWGWLAAIALGGALIGVLQQPILRPSVARSWW